MNKNFSRLYKVFSILSLIVIGLTTCFYGNELTSLAAPLNSALTVTDVDPDEGPNDLDVQVTITGSGFSSGAEVHLGETSLTDVVVVDENTIEVTVPWGMNPGVYTLLVTNPNNDTDELSNAYTVTQGIGEWSTGGPYGGWINDIKFGENTDTVYATVTNVGLFRSTDGGENWELIFIEMGYVNFVEIDPRDPDSLYIAKTNGGLYHSEDGGDTWQEMPIPIPGNPTDMLRIFISPYDYKMYGAIASGGFEGEACEQGCGLFVYNETGETWKRLSHGTILDANTGITMVGFDPDDNDKIYAGGARGQVLVSEDDGETWAALPDTPLGYIVKMFISPYDGSVWIIGNGEGRSGGFYKYEEDAWVTKTEAGIDPVYDMVFDPDSAAIWVSAFEDGILESDDEFTTWSVRYDERTEVLALDPADTSVIYSGSNKGIAKTTTGGSAWEQKNEGITGVVPVNLGMSPHDPAVIYGTVDSIGIFHSTDGGATWEELLYHASGPIVVDPGNPLHVVVADSDYIRISNDGTHFNVDVKIDLPVGMSSTDYQVYPMDIIARPGLWVMVAAYLDKHEDAHNYFGGGGIYTSTDGNNWTLIEPKQACPLTSVSFDPVDENIVYAVGMEEWAAESCEGDFLKSTDYGQTWESTTYTPEIGWGKYMAVEPTPPYRIFLEAMVSADQGETWETLLTPFSSYCRKGLLFIEGTPSTLYAATCGGLYRTMNGGLSWQKAQGSLGELEIWALTGMSVDEREILFAATIGGDIEPRSIGITAMDLSQESLVNGGVYRNTFVRSRRINYLPFLAK
jgi:photosystem II stability/assembly factor-like uncharacterized protein